CQQVSFFRAGAGRSDLSVRLLFRGDERDPLVLFPVSESVTSWRTRESRKRRAAEEAFAGRSVQRLVQSRLWPNAGRLRVFGASLAPLARFHGADFNARVRPQPGHLPAARV